MCGITGIFNIKEQTNALREKALSMARKLRHRGPDWSGLYVGGSAILAHERLAIVDPLSGGQPLYTPDRKVVLAVNGEIYNHQDIRERYAGRYEFQTGSDCEVILALYRDKGVDFLEDLNGIFAFALYDEERDEFLIARDPIGVIPLYIGRDREGRLYFGSELKALEGFCDEYEPFLPGHYYWSREGKMHRWYRRDWEDYDAVKDNPAPVRSVREGLEAAVRRQMMSDVPYGVLLSGGLDSSVIAAVTARFAAHRVETGGRAAAWWPRLHSFAVGLEGSPDLAKAAEVAKALGTVHHEVKYTVQEGLDALRDVIYFIETYDVTTVRASTPMYLLARFIKSMGIKMVLSGEGADEIYAGYEWYADTPLMQKYKHIPAPLRHLASDASQHLPYFKGHDFIIKGSGRPEDWFIGQAHVFEEKDAYDILRPKYRVGPTAREVAAPIYDRVKDLSELEKKQYLDLNLWLPGDILLKADKMSMAHSLELRVPYLDREVLREAQTYPDSYKLRGDTKAVLRTAANKTLPDAWANRTKKGFPVPIAKWLEDPEFSAKVRKSFAGDVAGEYFDQDKLLAMLDDPKHERRKIWTAYTFLTWHEQFFEKFDA